MEPLITEGIKVSVEVFFQDEYSKPLADQYVFSYRVTIKNESNKTVQLISRHWYIQDASGGNREVKGEGVVGKQPILDPGDSHQYVSWCPLNTTVGKMYGTYQMMDIESGDLFDVRIPEFRMAASFVLN